MNNRIASILLTCSALAFGHPAVAEDVPPAVESPAAEKAAEAPQAAEAAASAASKADAAAAAPIAAPAAAADASAAATAAASGDEEDRIVCKRVETTGTRLRKSKVCKPVSFWRKLEKSADDTVAGIERGSSTGVQDLPGR